MKPKLQRNTKPPLWLMHSVLVAQLLYKYTHSNYIWSCKAIKVFKKSFSQVLSYPNEFLLIISTD
ncbi:MAG: hypothetical protein O9294_18375, partial [Cytophagales bacterium]|nr:hypothetical protein [Cytophagales bacterium]